MKRNTRRDRKIYKMNKDKGMSTYAIAQELGMNQPNVRRSVKRMERDMAKEKNKAKEKEQYLIEAANKDVS